MVALQESPAQTHAVHYEHLVRDPENTLNAVEQRSVERVIKKALRGGTAGVMRRHPRADMLRCLPVAPLMINQHSIFGYHQPEASSTAGKRIGPFGQT
jgi:hypothetical protein